MTPLDFRYFLSSQSPTHLGKQGHRSTQQFDEAIHVIHSFHTLLLSISLSLSLSLIAGPVWE